MPYHYLWKHLCFCTNLTANALLIEEHFTGNPEEAPLSHYKKAFEKKTGSVSHRCSQKNIQRPMLQTSQRCHHHHKSNTSDLPHFFLLLHQNFPLLTCLGMWSVMWQTRARAQTKPAKKGFLFIWMTCQTCSLWGSREVEAAEKCFLLQFLSLKCLDYELKPLKMGALLAIWDYYKVKKNSSKNVL